MQERKTITAFADLAEAVKNITVPMGTAENELPLRRTVAATVEGQGSDIGGLMVNKILGEYSTESVSGKTRIDIKNDATLEITGNPEESAQSFIYVFGGNVNLVLDNVNISNGITGLSVTGNSTVSITLKGKNTMSSTTTFDSAGIYVKEDSTLIINEDSTGSLLVTGGEDAAGIGGRQNGSGGTVTINGGTITANGGKWGAGIGGGQYGSGGTVTINGGTVTANGGEYGAGIGGGTNGSGGIVAINEGTVTANGGQWAAGIGGGYNGSGGTVTIKGGIVTANGGENGAGIGGGDDSGYQGTLLSNDDGKAWINASSVSANTENFKSGVLFKGNEGTVYGNYYLSKDHEIEKEKTMNIPANQSLNISGNNTLTVNGEIVNSGILTFNNGVLNGTGIISGTGEFKTNMFTPDDIQSIPDQTYTGSVIEPAVTINDKKTILGKAFDIDASSYDKTYEDNTNAGTAKVVFTDKTDGNKKVEKTFNIVKSGTTFDGGIKTYKDNTETNTFTYGDTITAKVTPKATGTAPVTKGLKAMLSFSAPTVNQMALFAGDTQISDTVSADSNGVYTMTYDTKFKNLVIGSNTITAKYVGNSNIADYSENATITLNKKAITSAGVNASASKEYNGTNSFISVALTTLTGVESGDTVSATADGTVTDVNVGTGKAFTAASITLDGKDEVYYSLDKAAVSGNVSITQADITGTKQELQVVKGLEKEYTFDLTKLLPQLPKDKSFGDINYTVETVDDIDKVLTQKPTSSDIKEDKITLKVANVTDKDKTAAIQIKVTSKNYKDFTADLNVKTTDKLPLTVETVFTGGTYNGNPYTYTGTPTFKNGTETVTGITYTTKYVGRDGTTYDESETAPTNVGSYNLIISIPTDNEMYTGKIEIPFTISKKDITVKADDKSIYVGGSIPENSALTYTVTGLIGSDTLKTVPTLTLDAKAVSTSAGTYTITVEGAAVGDNYNVIMKNGTFNVTPAPYVPPYNPPTPTPQPKTETREIPVVVDNGGAQTNAVQVPVTRVTDTDGTKTDTVKFDEDKAKETVTKALETKTNTATINVTDIPGNNADKVEVQVPQRSMTELGSNNIGLDVKTEKAALELPKETVSGLKDKAAKIQISEVKDSSKVEETKGLILKLASGSEVIAAPLKIETNFTGRTKITLPIDASKLPASKEALDKFISSLAVVVQHSDGENTVDKGTIVYDSKGNPIGLSIWVNKFSTFTLVELPDNYFDGRTAIMPDKVAPDKEWHITFTKEADKSTLTPENVYVLDSAGNKVEIKISYGSDNILRVDPVNNYKSGETYYLYISKKVTSKNKTPLPRALKFQFTVK
ncbi:hypothetical protein CLCAR_0496 [Clostridium carboxidivorans P7]|nr:hypothetical protein CLCAR_0496 [Clostridium carboxidivorans P7]